MNLNTLYNYINEEGRAKNPFETVKSEYLFDEVFKTAIDPMFKESYEKGSAAEDAVYSYAANERRTAFIIGFKTAVSLFTDGGIEE